MSAWVVGKDHIDLLVTAVLDRQIMDPATGEPWREQDAGDLGRLLWAENVASVVHRYSLERSCQEARMYEAAMRRYAFVRCPEPVGEWEPGEVVGAACASYIYQSCEHPGWERSSARLVACALEDLCPFLRSGTQASHVGWSFTTAAPAGVTSC